MSTNATMIKNKGICGIVLTLFTWLCLAGCDKHTGGSKGEFDRFTRELTVDDWQFKLNVENQNRLKQEDTAALDGQYLKATLHLSNGRTQKPLLYSVSADGEEYEANYRFLAFDCRDDLYIKYKDEFIYPIGYVFEPSNGLAGTERLVYKFRIENKIFDEMKRDNSEVEYWYIERLAGLGKICFTHNN